MGGSRKGRMGGSTAGAGPAGDAYVQNAERLSLMKQEHSATL